MNARQHCLSAVRCQYCLKRHCYNSPDFLSLSLMRKIISWAENALSENEQTLKPRRISVKVETPQRCVSPLPEPVINNSRQHTIKDIQCLFCESAKPVRCLSCLRFWVLWWVPENEFFRCRKTDVCLTPMALKIILLQHATTQARHTLPGQQNRCVTQ